MEAAKGFEATAEFVVKLSFHPCNIRTPHKKQMKHSSQAAPKMSACPSSTEEAGFWVWVQALNLIKQI